MSPTTNSSAGSTDSIHSLITLALLGTNRSISLDKEAAADSLMNEKMPVKRLTITNATPRTSGSVEGCAI